MISDQTLNQLLNCYDDDNSAIKFSEKIIKNRNYIYSYDSKIAETYHGVFNINSLDKIDFSGRFDIQIDSEVLLQCLFCDGSNNHLYISYNGWRPEESIKNDPEYNNPSFPRWGYYKLYDGCFLGIDDPMYKTYKNLNLGWYYGNKKFFISIIPLI